ncbi:RNA polymerase sigma-70 factor [Arenibacter certesii]|uniref:DNA-directed RNA polymerase sigma-70 factor n=1 Tax=Arenibacter certesii TaxID=228955 RepID=A0A918IPB9_9FLAO|nr:RNA polymerase sigma-70 factor [Arenibacter certesii]GGW22189.1 DNA-directed RNA polymerase sigma-70 factor [Arenibacter certesii]
MSKENIALTPKEYKQLFEALYTPLCLFAHRYLKNTEDSRDVVQDVFVNIWQKKIMIKDKAATKSYLYTAVRNKCLDFLKSSYSRTKSQRIGLDMMHLEGESFFIREVLLVETSEKVDKALDSIPKKYKKVIKLGMRGLTNDQIAERLQVSVNTIKSQKKVAYRKLKLLLKNDIFQILLLFSL